MGYIAQAVIWATVCFMFLRIAARRKRGTFQADGDAPPKNPNDGNA